MLNKNIYRVITASLIALFMFGNADANPEVSRKKHKGLKKGVNVSLNIKNKKKFPQVTYFNFGILSNFSQLDGVGINLLSSVNHYYTKGFQFSGFTNITGINSSGVQLSGLANIVGKKANGVLIGGLMNVSGKSASGIQLSGLGNVTVEKLNGVSISGLVNISSKQSEGLQISGLTNLSGTDHRGVAIGGLSNVAGNNIYGIQISSLLNVAGNQNRGVQLAALSNVSVQNCGLQTSLLNYAEKNKGLQLGLSNLAVTDSKGTQVGIVNISNDSCSHQIGLINLKPHTRIQMIVSGGNTNLVNAAVRFRNKYTYTQFGIGTQYLGIDRDFSLSASYRTGLYHTFGKRFSLSGDLGYYHIEAFDNKDNGFPSRMYAIQPNINLEYQFTKRIGAFASGGYNWTFSYKGSHKIDNKCVFEIGIVLF